MNIQIFLLACILTGCSSKTSHLKSFQSLDIYGSSQIIHDPHKLKTLESKDFLQPQPYQKVYLVYEQKPYQKAEIIHYYSNGQPHEYLEVLENKAFGNYQQWHSDGKIKIKAKVLGGIGEITDQAKTTWIYDGLCSVYDHAEQKEAEFFYVQGSKEGFSYLYYPNQKVCEQYSYKHDLLDGICRFYYPTGNLKKEEHWFQNVREGLYCWYWPNSKKAFEGFFESNKLVSGTLWDSSGQICCNIDNGSGIAISDLTASGFCLETVEDGQTCGWKWVYEKNQSRLSFCLNHRETKQIWLYPKDLTINECVILLNKLKKNPEIEDLLPNMGQTIRLSIRLQDDNLHGKTSSYFPNSQIQTQGSYRDNQKDGLHICYYPNGVVKSIEEYELDVLQSGSYFSKTNSKPVSVIQKGNGWAIIYDDFGQIEKKVLYENGEPKI